MRKKSLKIFLVILYLLNLIVEYVNIIGAYLKSLLTDNNLPIFIKLPPRIEAFRSIKTGLVAQLLRSIYRLRQSSQLWNQKVIAFFKNFGFKTLNVDLCIFVKQTKKGIILVNVYLDDFLLMAKD